MSVSDPAAERALLGAILLSPPAFDTAQGFGVSEHWFADPAHALLWTSMTRCASRGIDVVTLSTDLSERGELDHVGGFPYLGGLPGACPSGANLPEYLRAVGNCYRRRFLAERAQALSDAVEAGESLEAVSALAEQVKVPETGAQDASEDLADMVEQVAHDAMAERAGTKKSRRVRTGLWRLDKILKVHPGQLVILAGAPKMGKTMTALTIAKNAGRPGAPAGMVSCEMGMNDLGVRLLSTEACDTDVASVESIASALSSVLRNVPRGAVRVDCTALSLSAALRSCQVFVRKYGARILFVDYLQLLRLPVGENRTLAVGAACSAFKRAAKALDVPIVLLSQLNRSYASRNDQRPQPTDLRDSGQIEQDADAILFVYRPAVCEEEADPTAYEVIVSRQRNGGTGTAHLYWKQGHGWICDPPAYDDYEAPPLDRYGHVIGGSDR